MIDLYRQWTPETLDEMQKEIPNAKTKELVDVFIGTNSVHSHTKKFEEAVKVELRNRFSEGGKDVKGHAYLAGTKGGVKVEARRSFFLTEEAEESLEEANLLHLFPQKPNIEKMKSILRQLKIPDHAWMDPVVSMEALSDLVDRELIEAGYASTLVDYKTTYAVKTVELKALPDDNANHSD